MLKIRILPTLLFKEFSLVKGVKFDSSRRIGSVIQAVKVYNMRDVDELAFLDVSATLEKRHPDFELIDEIADECFMPLSVGGGIRTVGDVKRLLEVGADKVIVNTEAVLNPNIIKNIAKKFGSQCVVVSIDAKINKNKKYEVFICSGSKATGIDPVLFAKRAELLGAGEILLTSIDRDGTMEGYDVELVKKISSSVSVPVIASGGAGSYKHMESVIIDGNASAVAAASMFHFTEQTPLEAKKYLKKQGIDTRV